MERAMRQHDFPPKVVDAMAKKANYICSNPDCLCLTGYTTMEGKARSIAEGAHILPSGKGAESKGPTSIFPSAVRGTFAPTTLPAHWSR
jgi:hypothetical protein